MGMQRDNSIAPFQAGPNGVCSWPSPAGRVLNVLRESWKLHSSEQLRLDHLDRFVPGHSEEAVHGVEFSTEQALGGLGIDFDLDAQDRSSSVPNQ